MSTPAHELREHVFFRCGQAVSRLYEAGLVERPEVADSETEIREWWLVSPDLAERLQAAGQPVLRFHELHMWGRSSTQSSLRDDLELQRALAAK
jgi:hypothetical protein